MSSRFLRRPHRTTIRPVALGCAIALALSTAACGSRQSHETNLAAARGQEAEGSDLSEDQSGNTGALSGPVSTGDTTVDVAGTPEDAATGTGAATDLGTPSPGGTPTCTGRKAPIKIASVGHQTGVFGAFIGGGPRAVQAWANAVNARGGVNCHPIEYTIADDGGDPSRHQALVRQLVEQKGVIAFVQMNAPLTGQASVDYLRSNGIPVIGNEGGQQWFYENPNYFPQASTANGNIIATIAAAGAYSKVVGTNRLGSVSCIEAPICSNIYTYMPEHAPKHGLNLVYRAQASLVQPDYTSNCQGAKENDARIFFVGLDPNSISRVARSCESVGYKPHYFATSSTVLLSMAKDPRLDGMAFQMQVLPWMVTDHPAIREFHSVLRNHAPGLQPDAATVVGWTSAKLFEVAAAQVGDTPSSTDLMEALYSIKENDLGGLTYPLTFTRGQNAPQVACFWLAQITDGDFVALNGAKRTCVD